MSKVTVKVARSGLTRCPSCHTHVHYAEAVESGACPACGGARAPGVGVNLRASRAPRRARSLWRCRRGGLRLPEEESGTDAGMVEDGRARATSTLE